MRPMPKEVPFVLSNRTHSFMVFRTLEHYILIHHASIPKNIVLQIFSNPWVRVSWISDFRLELVDNVLFVSMSTISVNQHNVTNLGRRNVLLLQTLLKGRKMSRLSRGHGPPINFKIITGRQTPENPSI